MAQNTYVAGAVLTASQLNTEFTWVPFRYQVGTATFASSVTITFVTGRFTAAPIVVTQSKSVGSAVAYEFTNTPTTTSFNIERSVAGTWPSHWIAIQATSGAGSGP
jgi:hypothetical protein